MLAGRASSPSQLHRVNVILGKMQSLTGCVQSFIENPSQSYKASPAIWNQKTMQC